MKILVVEDDPLVQKALNFRLSKDGYDITIAPDGREGMRLLETNSFDMLLTDLMLPFNNGIELVNYAKEKLLKKIPVLVLSGVGQEKQVLEAFSLGADDYMTKPFSAVELSARVRRLSKMAT